VKGCTRLNEHQHEDIRKDLQIFSLKNRFLKYRHKLFQRVQQIYNDRLPKEAVAYRPNGRKLQGGPLKKWVDFEAGAGISVET
jgi:hypothetical protein